MAKCAYCGTSILFGGTTVGNYRFCNDKCAQYSTVLLTADRVPEQLLQETTAQVHAGPCPRCNGEGPVDVHRSYRVWSAVFMTGWNTRTHICCRSCANKSRLADTAYCAVLGWWGFPWGFLVTPVQLVRNISGFYRSGSPWEPSEDLRRLVRLRIAAHALSEAANAEQTPESR